MATYYVSSTQDVHSSSGNAGTLEDPMGLVEGITAATNPGDELIVMADGDYMVTTEINAGWSTTSTSESPIKITGANSNGEVDGTKPLIYINPSSGNLGIFTGNNSVGSYWFSHLRVHNRSRWGWRGFSNILLYDILDDSPLSRYTIETCNGHFFKVHKIGGNSLSYLTNHTAYFEDCLAIGCNMGYRATGSSDTAFFRRCVAKNCTSHGFSFNDSGSNGAIIIVDSVAVSCGGSGIHVDNVTSNANMYMKNVIIHDNDSDGLTFGNNSNTGSSMQCVMSGCLITNNGGYAVQTTSSAQRIILDHVAVLNNTSGISNAAAFSGSFYILSENPYTDDANGDYSLNDTIGGGKDLRDLFSPWQPPNSDMSYSVYPFRSLVPASFGGGSVNVLRKYTI